MGKTPEYGFPAPKNWGLPFKERIAEAETQRLWLARWLNMKLKTDEGIELAYRLNRCRPTRPCGSGACPSCTVTAQDQLGQAIYKKAKTAPAETVFTMSIVPQEGLVPLGKLAKVPIHEMKHRLHVALEISGVEWAAGGIDISLNKYEPEVGSFWSTHFYLIGGVRNPRSARSNLLRFFPSSFRIPRPVRFEIWDGRLNAPLYALKHEFKKRLSATTFDFRRDDRPYWSSTERLLSVERKELYLALEEIILINRIFRHNIG